MSYTQTTIDRKDAEQLRKVLRKETSVQETHSILKYIFSDLIKWTREDIETHLSSVYNFTPIEIDQFIEQNPNIIYLPENVYRMNIANLPPEGAQDSFGKILVFQKQNGWEVIEHSQVEDFINRYQCTHFTYTPSVP